MPNLIKSYTVYLPFLGERDVEVLKKTLGIWQKSENFTFLNTFLWDNGDVESYLGNLQNGEIIDYQEAMDIIFKHRQMYKETPACQPKPRFHKKRKPVPKRKKTDVVITYENDMIYTLKNISSIRGDGENITIKGYGCPSKGVKVTTQIELDRDEVKTLHIKTPKGDVDILVLYNYYKVKDKRIESNTTHAKLFSYTY